jgi:dystonin
VKEIEIYIAKFRILLNDIELISYDIGQLNQNDYEDKQTVLLINNRWEDLIKQTNEKYHLLETKLEQIKLKQKLIEQISNELYLIDQQVNQSTINTKFPLLIEHLEHLEQQIDKECPELKSKHQREISFYFSHFFSANLIDVKQRTLIKGQELLELTHSIELFHKSLQKFAEWLTESERYLNTRKPVPRRFGLFQTLLKQIDEHKTFENQLEIYKKHFIDLDKLATHLKYLAPKNDSIYIRNSLVSIQTRWQKILLRTNERTKELEKVFQQTKKVFLFNQEF